MAILLLIAGAFAADCDLDGALDQAQEAVLQLDFELAETRLAAAEEKFGCAPADAEQVARFWLATGAMEGFRGDEASRDEALVAAKAARIFFWDPVWGDDLEEAWKAARSDGAPASLRLLDVPEGYVTRVDGTIRTDPTEVAVDPGLHVVQVFAKDVGFARVVRAQPDGDVSIAPELDELPREQWAPDALVVEPLSEPDSGTDPTPEPISKPVPRTQPGDRPVALVFGIGLGVWAGPGFALDGIEESGTKFLPSVEAGVLYEPTDALWLRAAIGADIAVGSRFVYVVGDIDDPEGRALPVAPVLHASGGVHLGDGPFAVGGLVGLQLPSRLPVRAVGIWTSGRYGVEARLGANLLGERSVESGVQTGRVRIEPAVTALGTLRL